MHMLQVTSGIQPGIREPHSTLITTSLWSSCLSVGRAWWHPDRIPK